MNEPLRYAVVRLEPGWVGLLGSPRGLRRLVLPQRAAGLAKSGLGLPRDGAVADVPFFKPLLSRLEAYFAGREVSFDDLLDLNEATVFQLRVWQTTRSIPYGETRSYAWVADSAGRPGAARAAGQALAANPAPIIVPCHRVVASGGGLGGFSGGLAVKEYLLRLEGFRVGARSS